MRRLTVRTSVRRMWLIRLRVCGVCRPGTEDAVKEAVRAEIDGGHSDVVLEVRDGPGEEGF